MFIVVLTNLFVLLPKDVYHNLGVYLYCFHVTYSVSIDLKALVLYFFSLLCLILSEIGLHGYLPHKYSNISVFNIFVIYCFLTWNNIDLQHFLAALTPLEPTPTKLISVKYSKQEVIIKIRSFGYFCFWKKQYPVFQSVIQRVSKYMVYISPLLHSADVFYMITGNH